MTLEVAAMLIAGLALLISVCQWLSDRSGIPSRPETLLDRDVGACTTYPGTIIDKLGSVFAQRIIVQLKSDTPPYKLVEVTEGYSNTFDVLRIGDEVNVILGKEPKLHSVIANLAERRS